MNKDMLAISLVVDLGSVAEMDTSEREGQPEAEGLDGNGTQLGKDSEATDTTCQKFKLSHKQWRRLLKKEKRKVKRQLYAKARAKLKQEENTRIEEDPALREAKQTAEHLDEQKERWNEYERKRRHLEWLKREREVVGQLEKQRTIEAKKEKEREEQEKLIREEWEKQEQIDKEKAEKDAEAKRVQEEKLDKELAKSGINPTSTSNEWHNPFGPSKETDSSSSLFGTEKDPENCSFFLKTGACRFGERCSRHHPRPTSGVTILIPNMFQDVRLAQALLDEHDNDFALEYEDKDIYENFLRFYNDVMPEFNAAGRLVQFKVCCNHEPHLRGNVFAQYFTEEEALAAFVAFNGRWYAGRQLSVQFSLVTKWKSAICGLFERNRCPKGKNCNFLHVFRNPQNAFRDADRDFEGSSRRHERSWSRRSSMTDRESERESRRSVHASRRSRSPSMKSSHSRSPSRRRNHSHHSRHDISCSSSSSRSHRKRYSSSRSPSPHDKRRKSRRREVTIEKETCEAKSREDSNGNHRVSEECGSAANETITVNAFDNDNIVAGRRHESDSRGRDQKTKKKKKASKPSHHHKKRRIKHKTQDKIDTSLSSSSSHSEWSDSPKEG